jgi:hypothetical protein
VSWAKLRWDKVLRRNKRDYCEVFGSEAGKRVLRNIIEESGFNADPYVPGVPDHTCYFVGKHWIVRHIRNTMRMTEDELDNYTKVAEEQAIQEQEQGV